MVTVGIKELKQKASQLIRMVRTQGTEIHITYHGKVAAILAPIGNPPQDSDKAWVELDQLAGQIGNKWQPGMTAVEVVSEGRE